MALSRRLRTERPLGSLSLSELSILGVLHRQGVLVSNRLAALEQLQPQSLTRLLSDLERKGLITRTRGTTDRREINIAITAKGRQFLIDDLKLRRDSLQFLLATALGDEDRAVVLSAAPLLLKISEY